MAQSLIFFDIDGTILDGEYRIPESAVRAIREARRRGSLCVINTGRPFSHIEPGVTAIGFDGYVCACGQHVLMHGESIFRRSLPGDVCRNILRLVREGRLDVIYEDEGGIWFDRTRPMRPEARDTYAHFAARGFDVDRSIDRPDFRFDKFCVWVNPDSDPSPLLAYVRPWCTVIDREGDLVEFVVAGCSKETGLQMVMERSGVPPENCYAIGDSTNDLPMLRSVPHSIAMGNAPPEVKKIVEFVTDDLHRDGLEKALQHYGLI